MKPGAMGSPFLGLCRIYILSMFGFQLPTKASLRDPKKLAKGAGIVALVILVLADVGVLFVLMNLNLYDALKPAGLQGLMLLNAASTASVMVFLFGFITGLSTWSMSPMESSFLAMPISPRALLGAKMAMIYAANAAFSTLMLAIAAAVYGIREQPSLLFYIGAALTALALPLVPIAVSYVLLIPFMASSKRLANKNFLLYAGGGLGLIASVGFSTYIQTAASRMGDAAWLAKNFAGPDSIISKIGAAWPPAWLAWKSLAESSNASGLGFALLNIAGGLAVAGGVAFLLGPSYAKSVVAFGEASLRRRKITAEFMGRTFRRGPALLALTMREVRLMNREPMYLLNGPFVPVLMPFILALSFVVQPERMPQLLADLRPIFESPAGFLIPAAFGMFLGSSTSIACTAVSRDAKALPWMRSLPVDPLTYLGAKFLHAEIFALLGAAIGAGSAGVLLGFSAGKVVLSFILGLLGASTVNLAGLWLDTAMPRLRWDNPIVPLKQNPNSVAAILGSMGLIGGLGFLATKLPLDGTGFVLAYGAVFLAILLALGAAYPKFARARIRRWEA